MSKNTVLAIAALTMAAAGVVLVAVNSKASGNDHGTAYGTKIIDGVTYFSWTDPDNSSRVKVLLFDNDQPDYGAFWISVSQLEQYLSDPNYDCVPATEDQWIPYS
jgi:hypothetical protein